MANFRSCAHITFQSGDYCNVLLKHALISIKIYKNVKKIIELDLNGFNQHIIALSTEANTGSVALVDLGLVLLTNKFTTGFKKMRCSLINVLQISVNDETLLHPKLILLQ